MFLQERKTSDQETRQILQGINEEIEKDGGTLQYRHKWESGDFIISDNLSVGHEASQDTQKPRSEIGLRVMHRVTIAGKVVPSK